MKNNDESNSEEIVSDSVEALDVDTESEEKMDELHDEPEQSASIETDYLEVSVDTDEILVEMGDSADNVESNEAIEDGTTISDIQSDSSNEDMLDTHKSIDPVESTYLEDEFSEKKPSHTKRIIAIIVIIALLVLGTGLAVSGMFGLNNNLPSASDSLIRVYDVTEDLTKNNSQQVNLSVNGLGINMLADVKFDHKSNQAAIDFNMTVFGETTKMEMYLVDYDQKDPTKATLAFNIMDQIEVISLSDSEFSELFEQISIGQSSQNSDLAKMVEKNSKDIDKLFNVSESPNNYVYSMKEPVVIKQSDLAKNKEYAELVQQLNELGLGNIDITLDMSFSVNKSKGYMSNLELTVSVLGGMNYVIKLDQDLTTKVNVDIPSKIQAAIDAYNK